MSDTKALIKYVRDRLNDGPNITFGKPTVYDLVEALEQAEAENARLQQRVNELISEELTDGAVRERIQLRLNMHEVLQQNERLTKMVDWLAERAAIYAVRTEQHITMRSIWGQIEAARTAVDGGYQLEKSSTTVEATRRVVAKGEEPCQK